MDVGTIACLSLKAQPSCMHERIEGRGKRLRVITHFHALLTLFSSEPTCAVLDELIDSAELIDFLPT
jgi:hypothetical protein